MMVEVGRDSAPPLRFLCDKLHSTGEAAAQIEQNGFLNGESRRTLYP